MKKDPSQKPLLARRSSRFGIGKLPNMGALVKGIMKRGKNQKDLKDIKEDKEDKDIVEEGKADDKNESEDNSMSLGDATY